METSVPYLSARAAGLEGCYIYIAAAYNIPENNFARFH